MTKRKKHTNGKQGLVVGTTPGRFKVVDRRLMKPVCHQSYEDGVLKGSMLVQDIEKASLSKKSNVSYFVPNNIALLLSVSKKSSNQAKVIYARHFSNKELELELDKMVENRTEKMYEASTLVCDYLEYIQTSIVFGYTALEAFVNMSIPKGYEYSTEKNSKGISEIYDKTAIERWLPLKTKIKSILTDIYNTKKIDSQKWWGYILNLELFRNEIIHQKSISHTDFYKVYFKQNIFSVCQSPVELIKFFHDSHAEENKTNPLWPWLEGMETLPINTAYESSGFEIIGNMYEGIKK